MNIINSLIFYKLILVFLISTAAFAQEEKTKPKVFLMEIKSDIDPRMNRRVELALREASDNEVDYVIIEMDTYGGALNDADDIRTMILNYPIPVYVFINKDAASAGALISIACDSIYMAPGASIGAATVVTGGSGEAAPDKYQSYMRSMMRSTAEARGRNPRIAEAMVDERIEVDSISSIGQVITFSTSEALKYGFCEAEVRNIDQIMARSNVNDYELIKYSVSTTEKIIAFFLNPAISSVLILIIIGGLYFELQTPGVGFPILASIIAMILYFIPYYLTGLAAHWEILLFFIGVSLIVLEIFVIPGFGIAGIAGLILTIGSLILVMLDNNALDFTFVNPDEIIIASAATLIGLFGGVLLIFFGGFRFTQTKAFKRIALQNVQDRKEGYTSNFQVQSFLGKKGITYTILRPSGKIIIDDNIYDAYTRGNYIDKDVEVIVIEESGTSLKVKEVSKMSIETPGNSVSS
ncbi:MAG: nodulation protein NfeD [Bacteroidota bacterium]|jgi:membrane-bound serine protease (ClpP class)|nr:nodulation protein NfeD [Bacteroidota bacterium]